MGTLKPKLPGNLGGEELARDCALRHPVWVAEKSGCIAARIVENRRNSGGLAFKPHRRKSPVESRGQVFWRFSLEVTRTVPFQRLHQANAMRLQADDAAKAARLRKQLGTLFGVSYSAV